MAEWTIVVTLTTLIGLFITVGKPLINLNKSITTLNLNVEYMNKRIDEQEAILNKHKEKSHESHKRLWEHNDVQDERIQDHESRIKMLEKND